LIDWEAMKISAIKISNRHRKTLGDLCGLKERSES